MKTQIGRGSFIKLPHDIVKSLEKRVNDFIKKWDDVKALNTKWASYVRYSYSKPGTMYGMIKITKTGTAIV